MKNSNGGTKPLSRHSEADGEKETLVQRLSSFGHRLCVKHDFLSSGKVKGQTKDVRKYYDYLAPFYDFIYPWSTSYRQSGSFVVDSFVEPGDSVLDLGAGTGLLTIPMLSKAVSVISYDLHSKMLERGRRKSRKAMKDFEQPAAGLAFCQGDAIDLPFKEGAFDLVATAFMLVYLSPEQKLASLKECCRVIKNGGRIVLLTSQGEIHSRFSLREEWVELFDKAGFTRPEFNDFSDVFRTINARVAG